MLGLLTTSLAPREVALAFAILGIATAIADGAIAAVLGADPRRDEQPGGELARWCVAVVLSAAFAGGTVLAGPALARGLGHYEVASLAIWIVPLTLARVIDRHARGAWSASRTPSAHLEVVAWLVAVAVFVFFTSRGKTVTAVTAAAGAFAGVRGLLSLRLRTLRPSRRALLPVTSIAWRALRRSPVAMGWAILARLDVFVALLMLGAEAAGLWLVARTLMLDRDLAMWSLSLESDPAEPTARSGPSLGMVFLCTFALLAPVTLRDWIGPRYLPLAELTAWLLPATALLWLRQSVTPPRSRDIGLTAIAALCIAIAPRWFAVLPAIAMTIAISMTLAWSWRRVWSIERDPIRGSVMATGLGLLAALGAADLATAFGASGSGIFVAAILAGTGLWLAWVVGERWSLRELSATAAPIAAVAKESGE
jgi:hypothetical protein